MYRPVDHVGLSILREFGEYPYVFIGLVYEESLLLASCLVDYIGSQLRIDLNIVI